MNERALRSTILSFRPIIVFEIVLCRLRYKLSLRNLAEMYLLRGFEFTHETVRDWEERFAPMLTERLRRKRKGKAGRRWYVDETYLKVKGKWCYLYRAMDREGNLVDSMLSATGHGCRTAVLSQHSLRCGESPPADYYRWSFLLSSCHPRSARSESQSSLQRVLEPTDRARSSRSETALLPNARLGCVPLRPAFLWGVRGGFGSTFVPAVREDKSYRSPIKDVSFSSERRR
jgi:DDE superfamily endonuclease